MYVHKQIATKYCKTKFKIKVGLQDVTAISHYVYLYGGKIDKNAVTFDWKKIEG